MDFLRRPSERWTAYEDTVDGDGCSFWVRLPCSGLARLELIAFGVTEGILTCVVAMSFFFLIPDFPEEVSWLSAEERQFVKARLQEDVGESQRHKPLKPKDVFRILRECELSHHCALFHAIKRAIIREHHSWRIYVLRSHRPGLQLRYGAPVACMYTGPNLGFP